MHGVEVFCGQISDRMILSELGKIPDSLVDIFSIYQIFRNASRIFQARESPEVGKAMLQGLDSTLYKKCHELHTRQSTS
jgi:hypothetical protein